ncbi:MAG: hypothetical protein DYG91_14155, partial [Chloroflexi bacterium CFX7]|nr:hypothetical protein [Chloroflexi bacterium CFX7]
MDSFEELTNLFDELGVRWATAGAVAANRYRSSARLTEDTDRLVEWDPRLPERMQTLGWDLTVAADRGEPPHLIPARKTTSVDLMVALTDYHATALARARDHWLTVEDVSVHKLI